MVSRVFTTKFHFISECVVDGTLLVTMNQQVSSQPDTPRPIDGVTGRALPVPSRSEPPSIPDYELLRRIGAGSYGDVWLARSTTGALRAVKIVWRHIFEDDRPFQREFEGLQNFEHLSREHPSQLAIFHVGRGEGYFFYVMELADTAAGKERGAVQVEQVPPASFPLPIPDVTESHQSLDCQTYVPGTLRHDLQTGGRLPAARVLQLGLGLAEALTHLHRHGLVHRDIKPSNIIFVKGRAKLADVGLVTNAGDGRSIVGTEGYLAPEGSGTPQADLFALGKVLYEAATGFDRRQFPKLPPDLRGWEDAALVFELNEIFLRAGATNPRERYQSIEAMHAELALLQTGRSVQRRHAWQRNVNHAKNCALALVALMVVSAMVYPLVVWRSRPSRVGWSKNKEANEEYQKGSRAFHQDAVDSFDEAARHFERAIALDRDFARAYARLAITYTWMDPSDPKILLKARPLAERALLLDPRLDEAHNAVASVNSLLLRDWGGAENEALEAIRLNPASDDNFYAYAGLLSIVGRTNEAVQQVEQALLLDPRSFVSQQFAAFVFLSARQYDRAIGIINHIIDRQPTSRARLTKGFLVPAYQEKGDYPRAIDLERQAELLGGNPADQVNARYGALMNAYVQGQAKGYWQQVLDWRKNIERDPVQLAILYARVGDQDMAFQYLDQALAETPPTRLSFVINREPGFDNLRSHPHFTGILRKLGFTP